MTVLVLLLATLINPAPGDERASGPGGSIPVAEARLLAWQTLQGEACVEGVVTMETGVLKSGPRDFYVQDRTGGIFVQASGGADVPRGAAVRACGRPELYDQMEPQLGQAKVVLLGKAPVPRPLRLSVKEAVDGRAAGSLVSVRGVVQRLSIGELRDVLWLGAGGAEVRVYIRRERDAPSGMARIAPVGATVEATGILIPEEPNRCQLRLRTTGDLTLVSPPGHAELRYLRRGLGVLLIGFGVAGAWALLLRRAVRRQTAEIRRLMVEARQSEQAKSQFLANMSHELRTPLNGIIGMTELALDTKLTVEQRAYLEATRSSARALLRMVEDILDFSRLEKGRMETHCEPFDLRAAVDESLAPLAAAAERKGLSLELDIDAAVPPVVIGDARNLRQVLFHLVGNAVKFTHAGMVRLALCAEEGGKIRFEVSDTGIGIPPEKQQEVLRAFTQADPSSTRQYGGAGLGLAISEQLVRLMGGRLELESEPGKGTRFFFSLPLPAAEESPQQSGGRAQGARPGKLRILLCEDNPVIVRFLERLLSSEGCDVVCVSDSGSAVAQARRGGWDLILLDADMADAESESAVQQIRRLEEESGRARTPLIGLTTRSFPEDLRPCLDAGMDACLSKPLHVEDLLRVLESLGGRPLPAAR